jgi:hypothetical protein
MNIRVFEKREKSFEIFLFCLFGPKKRKKTQFQELKVLNELYR